MCCNSVRRSQTFLLCQKEVEFGGSEGNIGNHGDCGGGGGAD